MKYFKIILAAVTFSLFSAALHAQISINGLIMNEFYTEEEIIEILGTPDSIAYAIEGYIYFRYQEEKETQQNISVPIGDKVELPDNESIDYIGFDKWQGKEGLHFANYIINTKRFSFNNKFWVGDPISKVKAEGGQFLDRKNKNGGGCLTWAGGGDVDSGPIEWIVCPRFYYDENGIITCMELWYS